MPGLLTLRTNLKSLKYGQDRPGGGDSGQPFITTDINNVSGGIPFDDGFVRHGTVGASDASEVDRIRIKKFLYNDTKGKLFITKQVGLQLSNPKLEVKNINIGGGKFLNFVGQVANRINQQIGPTRIYNGGVNTLAQIPVNAFGTHFLRHGVLTDQPEENKYENVVRTNNENDNRLITLRGKFELGDIISNNTTNNPFNRINRIISNVSNIFNTISAPLGGPVIPKIKLNPQQYIISQYVGGPNSIYGLGQTTIRRYDNTEDGSKIQDAIERSKNFAGKTRDKNNAPTSPAIYFSKVSSGATIQVSDAYYNGSVGDATENFNYIGLHTYDAPNKKEIYYTSDKSGVLTQQREYQDPNMGVFPEITVIGERKASYKIYKKLLDNKQLTQYSKIIDGELANEFGIYGNTDVKNTSKPNLLPTSTNRPNYTDGKSLIYINLPWNKVSREVRVGSGLQDQINLTPIFSSTSYSNFNKIKLNDKNGEYNVRDLVKFIIQSVDTDLPTNSTFMIFRAYLTQLSDSIDSSWADIKYAGRGNPFYIYNGFSRKIQVGFKVAALSVEEMQPMYSKLNYLMSTLTPDYSNNLMRGSLHRLTIGNYFDAQLGILNSLTYNIPNDSPWEISLDEPEGGSKTLILPHIIEVSMTFTPIGAETGYRSDNFNRIESKSNKISFIAQNTTGVDKNKIQYIDGFREDESDLKNIRNVKEFS